MNLLARAKLSAHLIFSSRLQGTRISYPTPVTALQQCNFYATKATHSSLKTTKSRSQKSSEPSPLSFSERNKKQAEVLATVWPRPREITYQAQVANLVNLIGYVKIPVRFEAASDGKYLATTVISLGNKGGKSSLVIPVVFEGDLAHIVSCHVKENDRVFVSGQLSMDNMRLVLSESLGKFHVVAENINFVEGFEKDKKMEVQLFSGDEIDKNVKGALEKIENLVEKVEKENGGSMPEKSYNKIEVFATKKKDGDQTLDLWRNLVKNPLQWWDYRDHKINGLVKEKFPDFKQKVTGESLWISSAPQWVLAGLAKLEFDVKDGEGLTFRRKRNDKLNDCWKNLVENPDKWWDNRMKKTSPKAPDFKHKETGEVLWLNTLPAWAVSRLPPVKDGKNMVTV